MPRSLTLALALALPGLCPLGPAAAQRSRFEQPPGGRPAVTFMAGPSAYDLSGTGTSAFGAVRFDIPSGRVLIFEPGLAVFRYTTQADETLTYILPELSLQAQVPSGALRPYAGGGIGFTEFLSGRGQSDVTLHAAAGLRLDLGDRWGLRGEARLRSIDPFAGNTFDVGFGVSRRLGR